MPKVYSFKIYDPVNDTYNTASFKATLDLIEQEHGIAIPESEEFTSLYLVKDNGGYKLVE